MATQKHLNRECKGGSLFKDQRPPHVFLIDLKVSACHKLGPPRASSPAADMQVALLRSPDICFASSSVAVSEIRGMAVLRFGRSAASDLKKVLSPMQTVS